MAADGLRNDIIASHLSLQRQIVSKWRKGFCVAVEVKAPRVRKSAHSWRSAGALVVARVARVARVASRGRHARRRGDNRRHDRVALAGGRCDPPVAPSQSVVSHAIPTSSRQPVRSLTCTPARGRASRCRRTTASCWLAKRRARKAAGADTRRCPPDRIASEPATGMAPAVIGWSRRSWRSRTRSARRVLWIVANGSGHRGPMATNAFNDSGRH
jgi:hypothetical protein